jgi:DNA repair protein RecO (recombination protein O)
MQWSDEGIILATRHHGESSLILEVMTPRHGRHLGLVRGGRSRRQQPFLQPGNSVSVTWRARLDEHLGNFAAEPTVERASRLMATACGIYGLQMLGALLHLLPERDSHPRLHTALGAILDGLDGDVVTAGELLVRFELEVLNALGYGLDLSRCAATGSTDDLAFVSPRSGRAVSRASGEPYRSRLFRLPRFLVARADGPPIAADLIDGFALCGYFFDRHVYGPRGLAESPARSSFIDLLRRAELPAAAE